MARVCSKHYEHCDFSGLLAELQNPKTGVIIPMPAPIQQPQKERSPYISPEARKRASLLSNPRMKYAYSYIDNVLHDRDCHVVKTIQDRNFRMLADFDTSHPTCRHCYRRAIIRSGIGDDAKHIDAYARFFSRLSASNADLRQLIIENGAQLSGIDLDKVVIKVHDDRWMICFVNNTPALYHNNYSIIGDYQRLFSTGFHPQNDGGNHNFHNFTKIMLSYSWENHVVHLKAKAFAEFQAKIRVRLAATDNWLRVPKISLLNSYYTVVDCSRRLGCLLRRNGIPFVPVKKVQEPGSSYRQVTCRIRKWQKKKLICVMEELKEYSFTSEFYDYVDACEKLESEARDQEQQRRNYA